ncbi:MAG: RHS repeat-associated core domain-containing protein, partial [Lacisediminihabitans sp.]
QLNTVATTPTGGSSTNASYTATPGGLVTQTATGSTLAYNTAQELTTLTPTAGGATAFTYDARGARLSAATAASAPVLASHSQYSYTATGALGTVALPSGNVIGYTSDGTNLRQSRTAAGGTAAFTWSTAGKLPLLLDDGVHSYIYGPSSSPIAQIDDTTHAIEYLHDDLIGTPRMISDNTGTVTGTFTFDPYGNQTDHTGTSTTSIGYSGNWTDPDTGLVYLRARDYDPKTAQFITVDPALSITHQPYAYASNDPLVATDPYGLWTIDNGLDWLAGSLLHGPGANITSFIVGFGDGASFGLSSVARNALSPGSDCTVAKDGFYFGGQVTGTVASTVVLGGAGVSAGAGIASAGKLAAAGKALGSGEGIAEDAGAAARFVASRQGVIDTEARALRSQVDEVVGSMKNTGRPPEGVRQGQSAGGKGVFENRDNVLPVKDPGYYKESDVWSGPGPRGGERVVTGESGEFYYSPDHYGTFRTW